MSGAPLPELDGLGAEQLPNFSDHLPAGMMRTCSIVPAMDSVPVATCVQLCLAGCT
jgi:hypothetical protein